MIAPPLRRSFLRARDAGVFEDVFSVHAMAWLVSIATMMEFRLSLSPAAHLANVYDRATHNGWSLSLARSASGSSATYLRQISIYMQDSQVWELKRRSYSCSRYKLTRRSTAAPSTASHA